MKCSQTAASRRRPVIYETLRAAEVPHWWQLSRALVITAGLQCPLCWQSAQPLPEKMCQTSPQRPQSCQVPSVWCGKQHYKRQGGGEHLPPLCAPSFLEGWIRLSADKSRAGSAAFSTDGCWCRIWAGVCLEAKGLRRGMHLKHKSLLALFLRGLC